MEKKNSKIALNVALFIIFTIIIALAGYYTGERDGIRKGITEKNVEYKQQIDKLESSIMDTNKTISKYKNIDSFRAQN